MRSSWKGKYINFTIYRFLKSKKSKFELKALDKFNTRSSSFVKALLYKDLLIHTGQFFIQKQMSYRYSNIKIGQFIPTRDKALHNKKDKAKRRLRALKKSQRRIKKHK